MKRSRTTSLFRVVSFAIASLCFRNVLVSVLLLVYLFLIHKKETVYYVLICLLLFVSNEYRSDWFPIGMIEYRKGDSYIVEKLFYRCRIPYDEELLPGDIVFCHGHSLNERENEMIKNVLYVCERSGKICCFVPRRYFRLKIEGLSEENRDIINKLLFNIYPVNELSYDLGYGLVSYYFFKQLGKRKPKLALLLIVIYSFLFTFDLKVVFIIIDLLHAKGVHAKTDRLAIKCLLLALLNIQLFRNTSFLLTLLFELYGVIAFPSGFKTYLFLVESFVFGEIDLLSSFCFGLMRRYRSFIFIISLMFVLFPQIETVFHLFLKLLDTYNGFSFSVRGSLSLIGSSLFLYCFFIIGISKDFHCALLLIVILLSGFNRPFTQVSFIDVGQGDASLISTSLNRSAVLIDTGSPYNYHRLRSFLFRQGVYKIDYLIVSHDDSDHNGNVEALQKDFKIGKIVDIGKDIDADGIIFKYHDLGSFDNDNDNSLVYSVDIDGLSFLYAGDISGEVERAFLHAYAPVHYDVLKVSHHGSKTGSSERFIAELLPEFSIISTSGQYGHPSWEVLNRLKRYGSHYYITRDKGDISFLFLKGLKLLKTANGEFVIIR